MQTGLSRCGAPDPELASPVRFSWGQDDLDISSEDAAIRLLDPAESQTCNRQYLYGLVHKATYLVQAFASPLPTTGMMLSVPAIRKKLIEHRVPFSMHPDSA